MIGSHNTFTYLEPTNKLFCWCKRFWKCQEIDIDKQYEMGVRYFDIRVFYNKKKDRWQLCHGLVNFDKTFLYLEFVFSHMEKKYPNAFYRIIIEKGDASIRQAEWLYVAKYCPHLVSITLKSQIGVKNLAENKELVKKLEPTWRSPNIEINGGYHYNNKVGVFKNLWRFLCSNIKKSMLKQTEGKIYLSENNIVNKDYVILSDYVNLLK